MLKKVRQFFKAPIQKEERGVEIPINPTHCDCGGELGHKILNFVDEFKTPEEGRKRRVVVLGKPVNYKYKKCNECGQHRTVHDSLS